MNPCPSAGLHEGVESLDYRARNGFAVSKHAPIRTAPNCKRTPVGTAMLRPACMR